MNSLLYLPCGGLHCAVIRRSQNYLLILQYWNYKRLFSMCLINLKVLIKIKNHIMHLLLLKWLRKWAWEGEGWHLDNCFSKRKIFPKSALLTLMSQGTSEKKKYVVLEGPGGPVLVSFISDAAGPHAISCHPFVFYCINTGERHVHPQAGAHTSGRVAVTISPSTRPRHLSEQSREVYMGEDPPSGASVQVRPQILPCDGHSWYQLHSLSKKRFYMK